LEDEQMLTIYLVQYEFVEKFFRKVLELDERKIINIYIVTPDDDKYDHMTTEYITFARCSKSEVKLNNVIAQERAADAGNMALHGKHLPR
jgi:hypothetical protein